MYAGRERHLRGGLLRGVLRRLRWRRVRPAAGRRRCLLHAACDARRAVLHRDCGRRPVQHGGKGVCDRVGGRPHPDRRSTIDHNPLRGHPLRVRRHQNGLQGRALLLARLRAALRRDRELSGQRGHQHIVQHARHPELGRDDRRVLRQYPDCPLDRLLPGRVGALWRRRDRRGRSVGREPLHNRVRRRLLLFNIRRAALVAAHAIRLRPNAGADERRRRALHARASLRRRRKL